MVPFIEPACPRAQQVLFPTRLDEVLPPDHPARHLEALLRSAYFAATFTRLEAAHAQVEGRPAYPPRKLVALYLYGLLERVRSSRELEEACRMRLDFRWLMEGLAPDHATIAAFVQRHQDTLRALFKDVLRVARQAGLLGAALHAVDGTFLEANASRGSVCSMEALEREEAELDALIQKLEAEYAQNEARQMPALFESPPPENTPLPEQLRRLKDKQARIQRAIEELFLRQAEHASAHPPPNRNSKTDPESREMPDKSGVARPGYNVQITVDAQAGVIVAQDVRAAAGDENQLVPQLAMAEENTGLKPQAVVADSQYNTGRDLADLEAQGIVTYLPDQGTRRAGPDAALEAARAAFRRGEALSPELLEQVLKRGRGQLPKALFEYDTEQDVYICPRGERLVPLEEVAVKRTSGSVRMTRYGGAACATCPLRSVCCKKDAPRRELVRDEFEPCRERQRERMATEAGRQTYKRRAPTVERVFGHIKAALGIRRFLRRGIEKVRTELSMITTAFNISRLFACWDTVELIL